jgi:two-component system phosphate regulon sensor histidine kinase PhoR
MPCNLTDLLAGQVAIWEKIVPQRELKLSLFSPQAEIWVQGDERRLSQLFDHLLRNAYNYTLPGGSIEVQLALKAESVMIYIIDSGVGIETDELGRVFERMYRGRSAEAGPTDSSGLGLGLYLAQYIVQAHKGSISLDSKVGQGTVVKIELPVVNIVWSQETLGTENEPVTG